MYFNEFSLKSIRLKLLEAIPELVGINIIKSFEGSNVDNYSHFMISKINIKGIDIYFDSELFDGRDVLEQCFENINECIKSRVIPFFESDVTSDFAEDQIVSALIFRTGITVEKYNYKMFELLGQEAALNNCKLEDLQNYIEDKFSEGGGWEAMLDGPEGIKFNSVINRNKG